MQGEVQRVVGRESELAAIVEFLGWPLEGPSALLIEGEAGIGKTTLWEAGIAAGREHGYRVLSARIGATETKLSFSVLGDLLEPVMDEALPDLPGPQRAALEVALLRADAVGPDREQLAVSLAGLGVVRTIARSSPVLLAMDDLQWLDGSSAKVLSFVVRRLADEPIGVLASIRHGASNGDRLALERTLPPERVRRVSVGPMSPEVLGRVIRQRVGTDLPRPALQRVHRLANGNPFFALEIAKELGRSGIPAAGEAFPVPRDVRDLLRADVMTLPRATREAMLVASATSRPTERLVEAASHLGSRTGAALAHAERKGVLRIVAGSISFTHPLLASTAYEAATADERRRVHQRLAAHVDDPEERARHLALGSDGADPDVASSLDDAAGLARARGAPDAAAELSELARRLTPHGDRDALLQRTVQAAEHHFDAGDVGRSIALFEEAIESATPGRDRARIIFLTGSHRWMNLPAVAKHCERVLTEAEGDPELLARAHEHLAWVDIYRGNLESASHHAELAVRHAEAMSSRTGKAEVLATFGTTEFLLGRPAENLMAEADRLQDLGTSTTTGDPTVYTSARANHGLQLIWAGELDAARHVLRRELDEYETRGLYLIRDEVLGYLGELECRAGRWGLAAEYAEEAYEIDVESGRVWGEGHTLFNVALVAAHRGDVETARSKAEEGLRVSLANDDPFYTSCCRAVLGFLELSLSNAAGALTHLRPVAEYLQSMGSAEPGVIPSRPDTIECLVAVGEVDEAERLLHQHEQTSSRSQRPWGIATTFRCAGLVQAVRGDPIGALESLAAAVREHQRVPQPFELGRTKLLQGEIARRAKRKALARESLTEARSIFDELGARLWSAKAEAELARVGGSASSGQLTPTEQRIADLVVEGMTNREIADALFISIRTVESNLSRVFHKRGVRSRAGLIRSMMSGSDGARPHPADAEA